MKYLALILMFGLLLTGDACAQRRLNKLQQHTETAYEDEANTFASLQTFSAGLSVGTFTPTLNGQMGWSGTQFLLREGGVNKTIGGTFSGDQDDATQGFFSATTGALHWKDGVSIGLAATDPGLYSLIQEGTSLAHIMRTVATAANGPTLYLDKAEDNLGSPAILVDGANIGRIVARGYDGTDYLTEGARIEFDVDGTPSLNSIPTKINFYNESSLGGVENTLSLGKGVLSVREIFEIQGALPGVPGVAGSNNARFYVDTQEVPPVVKLSIDTGEYVPLSVFNGLSVENADVSVATTVTTLDFSSAFTASESPVGEVNIGLAAIDHGSLNGLGDDDHTIYSLADGTRDYTGPVNLNAGTLTTGDNGLNVTATHATTAAFECGIDMVITTSGTAGAKAGFDLSLNGATTTASGTRGARFSNAATSSGTSLRDLNTNAGLVGDSTAANTGAGSSNVGLLGRARNADVNFGFVAKAATEGTDKINVGFYSLVKQTTGTTPIQIGVYAALGDTNPTLNSTAQSSALVADNFDQAVDIVQVRDNGVLTFQFVDGGYAQFTELAEPGSAAVGKHFFWFDSTSNTLKSKDSAGTVTEYGLGTSFQGVDVQIAGSSVNTSMTTLNFSDEFTGTENPAGVANIGIPVTARGSDSLTSSAKTKTVTLSKTMPDTSYHVSLMCVSDSQGPVAWQVGQRTTTTVNVTATANTGTLDFTYKAEDI